MKAAGIWNTQGSTEFGTHTEPRHEHGNRAFSFLLGFDWKIDLICGKAWGELLTERPGKGRGCAARDRKRKIKKQGLRKEKRGKYKKD